MWIEEIKNHLNEVIIPFWSDLRDNEFGGFYGLKDYNLTVYKEFQKGVILHSRILWFFSNAYTTLKTPSLLDNATHAFNFIKRHCIDPIYGGVYWSVQYNGQKYNDIKYTYNIAFAIYALSSYYEASKNLEALELADQLYEVIENKCRDEVGYLESFTREFEPIANEKLSENGVVASRTMNTLLHIFEGYTEYYRVSKKEKIKKRLIWLLDEFAEKVFNGHKNRQEVFFDDSMNSIIDLHSYGHDIETSWLIDRGCEVLDDELYTEKMRKITKALTENIYNIAYHKHSLWNECVNGSVDKRRIWWVQAETVVGFLNGYERDKEPQYLRAAVDTWNYIKEYIIDKREKSEWFWAVNDEGQVEAEFINPKDEYRSVISENGDMPMIKPLVEPWKCPYHNGRMCLEIIRRNINAE